MVLGALAQHFGTALCLQPTRELVRQNASKCAALGVQHSVYCAGLGSKDFSGPVVLGTGASLRKDLDNLPQVAVLIVDEAHRAIDEMLLIADVLRRRNPDLIVVGLTATPQLIGRGFIYRIKSDNSVLEASQAKNPPYSKCVYDLNPKELVDAGYLSPLTVGAALGSYDARKLVIERGRFTASSIAEMTGKITATVHIVHQLKEVMKTRDTCLIFASSVDHAETIRALLAGESTNRGQCRVITGSTPEKKRDHYLDMLNRRRLRYLINVATLTTGVDVPRLDTIAVMRPTDSPALFEQIIGRGMRLSPETGKEDCLVLDYAGNLTRFYPAGDIYTPQIQACGDKPEGFLLPVTCPTCGHLNEFKGMPNDEGLMINATGYFMTLDGHPVRDENGQEIPAHYGRRCRGATPEGVQCSHRWVGKKCFRCMAENDIAARKCTCGAPLVDWNKSLTKTASQMQTTAMRRGWTGERVEYLKFVESNSWIRADLYVKSRKSPLSVFIRSNEARIHMRQNVPYAVAWKKIEGQKHPAVKVLWTQEDWEKNR